MEDFHLIRIFLPLIHKGMSSHDTDNTTSYITGITFFHRPAESIHSDRPTVWTTGVPDLFHCRMSCKSFHQRNNLLLVLISLVANNVVEAKLVDTLGGRNDAEPVTELLLLEEFLRPIPPHKLASRRKT